MSCNKKKPNVQNFIKTTTKNPTTKKLFKSNSIAFSFNKISIISCFGILTFGWY